MQNILNFSICMNSKWSIGSTGPFDGAGNFGLEFPANGVVNHTNPTPCSESDSREYLYIKGVLDFIENHAGLDASKVYFEGFSQNSMFAAYASVCFADRVAGLWQGGSGLAKTFHTPLVPGLQAQCSASDYASLGNNCCAGELNLLRNYRNILWSLVTCNSSI